MCHIQIWPVSPGRLLSVAKQQKTRNERKSRYAFADQRRIPRECARMSTCARCNVTSYALGRMNARQQRYLYTPAVCSRKVCFRRCTYICIYTFSRFHSLFPAERARTAHLEVPVARRKHEWISIKSAPSRTLTLTQRRRLLLPSGSFVARVQIFARAP